MTIQPNPSIHLPVSVNILFAMNPVNHKTPDLYHRRSIRLKEFDYAQPSAYFITICTHNHKQIFGKIKLSNNGHPVGAGLAPAQNDNGQPRWLPQQDLNNIYAQMELNEFGQIALEEWRKLSYRFSTIELDAFVVMPNHVHGIIFITENGQSDGVGVNPTLTGQPQELGQPQGLPEPLRLPLHKRATLGDIVGAYKSLVSNECLKICKTKKEIMGKLWQRNYYEHIIRDQKSYQNIVSYIENNPSTWQQDELFRGETL